MDLISGIQMVMWHPGVLLQVESLTIVTFPSVLLEENLLARKVPSQAVQIQSCQVVEQVSGVLQMNSNADQVVPSVSCQSTFVMVTMTVPMERMKRNATISLDLFRISPSREGKGKQSNKTELAQSVNDGVFSG